MIENPTSDDSDLVGIISSRLSISRDDAWMWVEVIPVAFGSIIVDRAGAIRSGTFRRSLHVDRWSEEIPLTRLIFWEPALTYAHEQISAGMPEDDFYAVASRSPEIQALNNLLRAGENPAGAQSGPVMFLRPVSGFELLNYAPEPKKPEGEMRRWWKKFW